MNYKKAKQMSIPSQNLEYDPRSKANVKRARNVIPTGDKEKVRGTKRMLADKDKTATWYQIMWLSAIKLAVSAGSKIYANKQRTKMAQGEEAYQGKLLEARQSDWKDEAVLIILSLPVLVLAWAVVSDDPSAMDKVKLFFEMFSQLPSWFTNLWILVVASIYGIKGTQIFRNGGNKNGKQKI